MSLGQGIVSGKYERKVHPLAAGGSFPCTQDISLKEIKHLVRPRHFRNHNYKDPGKLRNQLSTADLEEKGINNMRCELDQSIVNV